MGLPLWVLALCLAFGAVCLWWNDDGTAMIQRTDTLGQVYYCSNQGTNCTWAGGGGGGGVWDN